MASAPLVARFIEFPELGATYDGLFKLFRDRIKLEHGMLHVPDGPGLGLEVDAAAVRASAARV
jgi:L-alanine-DL-glutamate epimerase-like enolase superfamily enzyme